MNILHVTPSMSPSWGGPVVVVSELIPALSEEGIRCEIVTTRGHRVGDDPVYPQGVPTHILDAGLPARIWTAYSRQLTGFLDENINRFDLVHIHEIWHYPGYAAFHAAKKNGIPLVITPHGELSEWSLGYKRWKKKIYMKVILGRMLQNADALHAIIQVEKDRIVSLGYQTPVTVAPNGIEPTQFNILPDPSEFLNRFPALKGKSVILFLGRLSPTKGLDILARSFSSISRNLPNSALLVVGPDESGTKEKTEAILSSEGTLDRTVFTGLLTGQDKLAAMACADVFVLPSHSDVLGIATLEAMAARLPVVISEGCNFPEVAENGAGFVVKASEKPVAEAIIGLLSDPCLRVRMGERGRKLVAGRYTWQATASKIADLYRTLVATKNQQTAD